MSYKEFVENLASFLKQEYPHFDVIVDDLETDFNNVIKIIVLTDIKHLMDKRYQTHIMVILDIYSDDILNIMDMGNNLFHKLEFLPYKGFLLKGYDYHFKAEGIQSTKKTFNSKQQKKSLGNASILYDIFEYKDEKLPTMMKYNEKYGVNDEK